MSDRYGNVFNDMSTHADLIDYFKLNAVYNPDTNSTREVTQTSNRAEFKRQVITVKEWKRSPKCLGRGAYGIVWLEHNHEGEEFRAVKEIPKGTPSYPINIDYKRELLALSQLSKHPAVFVNFHGWFEDDDSIFLAMEYFERGDLENYITPKLTEEDAKMIGRQLLEGLQILHGYNWAHRDLKPGNILVVRDAPHWWIKIGDFGYSRRILANQSGMHSRVGTEDYMAPEMIWSYDDTNNGEPLPFTLAVDMWSLGCVLFRLLTQQLPFESPSSLARYYRLKAPFPITALSQKGISKDGIAFISEIMKPRAADRMDVTAALHHSWTYIQNPNVEGPVPAEYNSSSKIIKEISTADLQLSARASYVNKDDNRRSHLKLGKAIMPQNPEYINILKNEDVAVRSAGIETAGNKLDRLEKNLDPREQTVEVQKRVLSTELAHSTLKFIASLFIAKLVTGVAFLILVCYARVHTGWWTNIDVALAVGVITSVFTFGVTGYRIFRHHRGNTFAGGSTLALLETFAIADFIAALLWSCTATLMMVLGEHGGKCSDTIVRPCQYQEHTLEWGDGPPVTWVIAKGFSFVQIFLFLLSGAIDFVVRRRNRVSGTGA